MTEEYKLRAEELKPEQVLRKYRAGSFKELSITVYDKEDQQLMRQGMWDYNNPELLTNHIYADLIALDISGLTEEEQVWYSEILWFWNHHAISCAIGRYHDFNAAKIYTEKALSYQDEGHPNQITRLFQLLLANNLIEAENFLTTITDEGEQETAQYLLESARNKWADF
jgi:hypothetical protein